MTATLEPAAPTRSPALTATLWGGAGLLGGAATGVLVLLPFYPDHDEGFAQLGWFLMALALGAALALIAGAVLLHRGLHRAGADHPGRTALVFVPTALLLGAFSGGVAALAAPAAAHWVADGFGRRASGWGPPRVAGLPQRLLVTVVVSVGLAVWGLNALGYELGGRVGGTFLTWLAVLPAVVVPPLLLLRQVLPWRVLGAGVAAAAVLLAPVTPHFTRDAHPTPERLEQIAQGLPVPEGQSVSEVRTTVLRDNGWDVPVTLLSTAGPAPALGVVPAATAQGTAAAAEWESVLRQEGWVPRRAEETSTYWLPDRAQPLVAGRQMYELGTWTRATVVPYGDGALLVLSVRP